MRQISRTSRAHSPFAAARLAAFLSIGPALALSEIKPDEVQPPSVSEPTPLPDITPQPPATSVPAPDPVQPPAPSTPAEAVEPEDESETADPARPHIDPEAADPEVIYDLARLPQSTRRMRELILEATKSGDIEKLRPLLGMGDDATMLSFGGVEGDLIEHLKQLSGDGEGHEILAILEEVLEAGFVNLDAGKPEELYVWPYFFAVNIENLTSPQRVELFRIVTAGDYEDMKNYGAYIFYRVGITPEGRWTFFVAGD
jgi:hypothetical protein